MFKRHYSSLSLNGYNNEKSKKIWTIQIKLSGQLACLGV